MKDLCTLTEISIRYLSNLLFPLVANETTSISELACLSPRLGNLLLKTLIELQRQNASQSTDCFLSLYQNINQNSPAK